MSGVHIVGHNDTTTSALLIIANSSNITYNDPERGNPCKALFWFFVCLFVLTFVLIILIWVRNTWRKGKQQEQNLNSINSAEPMTVWHIAVLLLANRWHYEDFTCRAEMNNWKRPKLALLQYNIYEIISQVVVIVQIKCTAISLIIVLKCYSS